jgi:hypothetical protein
MSSGASASASASASARGHDPGPDMLHLWFLVTGGLLGIRQDTGPCGPVALVAAGSQHPVTSDCLSLRLLIRGPHGPVWDPWAFLGAVGSVASIMGHTPRASGGRRRADKDPPCKLVQCGACGRVASLVAAWEAGSVEHPLCPHHGCLSSDLHYTRKVAVDTPAQALAVATVMGLDRALARAQAEVLAQAQAQAQAQAPVLTPVPLASCAGGGTGVAGATGAVAAAVTGDDDEWEEAVLSTSASAGWAAPGCSPGPR